MSYRVEGCVSALKNFGNSKDPPRAATADLAREVSRVLEALRPNRS